MTARAIRAADKVGKVALWTPAGILFAEPTSITLPSPQDSPAESPDDLLTGWIRANGGDIEGSA